MPCKANNSLEEMYFDEYFRLQGTLGDLKYDFSRGFFKAPPALARWCASK